MYKYPLTFTFPAFSLSPQITVKDASGAVILLAGKKLISSKEEINVNANSNQPVYKIISQENRITDIPSHWDIITVDGQKTLGVVDDDFLSALDATKFVGNTIGGNMLNREAHRALNLRAVKMYWLNSTDGKHLGFVAPEKKSLIAMQLPFARYIRKLPGLFFRLLTPAYYAQLGEEVKLYIQKKRTLFLDTYVAEVRGNFTEADESLLINGILLTLVYERQALKDVYTF